MRRRPRAERSPGRAALFVVATSLAVGVAWFVLETALLVLRDPSQDPVEFARRVGDLLPWQVVLFACLGLALVPCVRIVGRRTDDVLWWTVGAASVVFLGARVGEGLLRQHGTTRAVLGVGAVVLLVSAALACLRALGRWLPPALRGAWPLAASSGWTLLFLCTLRRAGPALGNGKTDLAGSLQFFEGEEALLAAAVAALVLLASSGMRRALSALACAAVLVTPRAGLGGEGPVGSGSPSPDVIVILVDTWRFDHLGVNAGRSDLTPNLDGFARESIRFTRGFSPSNVTSRAMPGVMSSLSPLVTLDGLPDEVDSLAELLKRAGYTTVGVSTNPNVSAEFGYAQGFDLFIDPTSQPDFLIANLLQLVGDALPGPAYQAGIIDAGLYYRPFGEVRRRGVRLLDRSPRPTFLYLHTMDLHGPYLAPRQYLPPGFVPADFYPYHRFNDLSGLGVLTSATFARHLANLRQRYEAGARYSDAEFGRLVEELRAAGRWDESLVWVLSDHGEAFGEHDYAGHGGSNVTMTLLRVPLLLKLPRSWGVAARVEETPVSTLDLLPTTLSLLGRTFPEQSFGRDLSDVVREGSDPGPRTIVSYAFTHRASDGASTKIYSAIDWPWKLDARFADGTAGEMSLFHLEEDPDERLDLAELRPDAVSALEAQVSAWRARELRFLMRSAPPAVSPLVREQLRQLGYVE
jgi:arylsulfatase